MGICPKMSNYSFGMILQLLYDITDNPTLILELNNY